jgi:hypothetical protein
MKGREYERVAVKVENSVDVLEEIRQYEPPPHDRAEAINGRQSAEATLVHEMQVDPGAGLVTHRLKSSAIAARETLVMDDFELERRPTGMDETRPYDGGGWSQIVGVERKTDDDAIAHSAF